MLDLMNADSVIEFLKNHGYSGNTISKYFLSTFWKLCKEIESRDVLTDPLFDSLDPEPKAAILLLSLEAELSKGASQSSSKVSTVLQKIIIDTDRSNVEQVFNVIHTHKNGSAFSCYLVQLISKSEQYKILKLLESASLEGFAPSELLDYIEAINNLNTCEIIGEQLANALKGKFIHAINDISTNNFKIEEFTLLSTRISKLIKNGIISKEILTQFKDTTKASPTVTQELSRNFLEKQKVCSVLKGSNTKHFSTIRTNKDEVLGKSIPKSQIEVVDVMGMNSSLNKTSAAIGEKYSIGNIKFAIPLLLMEQEIPNSSGSTMYTKAESDNRDLNNTKNEGNEALCTKLQKHIEAHMMLIKDTVVNCAKTLPLDQLNDRVPSSLLTHYDPLHERPLNIAAAARAVSAAEYSTQEVSTNFITSEIMNTNINEDKVMNTLFQMISSSGILADHKDLVYNSVLEDTFEQAKQTALDNSYTDASYSVEYIQQEIEATKALINSSFEDYTFNGM
jgi:hypothetical protein